jgi:protein ImuA
MSGSGREGLAALRRRIEAIEGAGRAAPVVLPFDVPAIDAALPGGGLLLGALHEIAGEGPDGEDGAVAAAFLAGILARLRPPRPLLWCLPAGDLYGPGLVSCGLSPERLILVEARRDAEVLWAIEEGLRSAALAAVIGEVESLPAPASRRLQLAAEASGVTAFALRRRRGAAAAGALAAPNAAMTRWRVAALPGAIAAGEPGVGRPLWRLTLWRCRGGVPASFDVEAGDATGHVALAAALADRPAPAIDAFAASLRSGEAGARRVAAKG